MRGWGFGMLTGHPDIAPGAARTALTSAWEDDMTRGAWALAVTLGAAAWAAAPAAAQGPEACDDTVAVVQALGHAVVSSPCNRGQGSALRLGYDLARRLDEMATRDEAASAIPAAIPLAPEAGA